MYILYFNIISHKNKGNLKINITTAVFIADKGCENNNIFANISCHSKKEKAKK